MFNQFLRSRPPHRPGRRALARVTRAACAPLSPRERIASAQSAQGGGPAQVRRVTARINEQLGTGPVRLVAEDGSSARRHARGRRAVPTRTSVASTSSRWRRPPIHRCAASWTTGRRHEEERKLRQSRRNQVHVSFKEATTAPEDRGARLRLEAKPGSRLPARRSEGEGDRVLPRPRARASRARPRADRSSRRRRRGGRKLEAPPVFESRTMTAVFSPDDEPPSPPQPVCVARSGSRCRAGEGTSTSPRSMPTKGWRCY